MASKNKKLQEIMNNTFGAFDQQRDSAYRCLTTSGNKPNRYNKDTAGLRNSYECSGMSPMITQSRKMNIDLLVKPKNALLASSVLHGNERIKKEINDLNKDFTKDGVPSGKFRNRPVLSMNRKDLDFSMKNLVSNSPYTTREHLTSDRKKRKKMTINSFIQNNKKEGFLFHQRENNNEFNCFMKEMTSLKSRMLYAKTQIEIK